jgi:hypothetical protein
VLDTWYTGFDLIAGTTCKKVVSNDFEKGKGNVGLQYIGGRPVQTLKFKVNHDTCDDGRGVVVVIEASEDESAKIMIGECGEVTSFFVDEDGTKRYNNKMYMLITPTMISTTITTTVTTLAPDMLQQTIHLFSATDMFGDVAKGCIELDTNYTGKDLMTGTSCKRVLASDAVTEKGSGFVTFKYLGSQKALKFKVQDICDDIHGMTIVIEASEVETAKILAGECGEVTSHEFEHGESSKSGDPIKMYMKITPPPNPKRVAPAAAPVTAAAPEPAERPNRVERRMTTSTTSAALSANMVEHTIHLFDGEGEGCIELDTTYIGTDLMTGTSCKQVVSDSIGKDEANVVLKYMGGSKTLKFKVHDTCDGIDERGTVIEASEAESAKILAGECGEVTVHAGDDKILKMHMKITVTTPTTAAALATTAAPAAAAAGVVDQAESTNIVIPIVSIILTMMIVAY